MAVPVQSIPIASCSMRAAPAPSWSDTSSRSDTSESATQNEGLSKALYIPYHTNKTTHLPLYDITDQYSASVGDLPIGSPRYKAQIRLMKKPSGNSLEGNVRYLIDFHCLERNATITERTIGRDGIEVDMSLPSTLGEEFRLGVVAPHQQGTNRVTAHYAPEPEKPKRKMAPENPSFAVQGGISKSSALEWKPFPFEPGCLTYGLFDSLSSMDVTEAEPRALYQHCRHEGDFVVSGHSEGILLLAGSEHPEDEALIVSSLVGLLWDLRCDRAAASKRRKSIFKNMFRTSL
ncbi:unnamed protein product [Clonostachys chloroleuca]|uniref:Uncharacterized protein n=1 Tax=Clonostachys chloroleuca TaxID=1926264 RepID=A0AA35MIE9_9HYPO|nr:unnamed protein product [Clonostachys chloroleuca]